MASPVFVGRQAELAVLLDALDGSGAGAVAGRRVRHEVLVTGEPRAEGESGAQARV